MRSDLSSSFGKIYIEYIKKSFCRQQDLLQTHVTAAENWKKYDFKLLYFEGKTDPRVIWVWGSMSHESTSPISRVVRQYSHFQAKTVAYFIFQFL